MNERSLVRVWVRAWLTVVALLLVSACQGPGQITGQGLVVDVGADRVVLVGQSVSLSAQLASEVEAAQAAYAWRFASRPAASSAALAGSAAAGASFVPDVAGVYEVEVQVTSGARAGSDRLLVTAVERGVRFTGDPSASVLAASYDVSLPMVVSHDEVSLLPDELFETFVVRTELELGVRADASVADVNALLAAYDAWIVDMLPRQRQFVVRIEDPGSLTALEALVARLEAEPLVEFVLMGVVGRAEDETLARTALPPTVTPTSTRIGHHLAVRMHAVWNLRSLLPPLQQRPYLVIADLFGSGPPGAGFDVVINAEQYETDEYTESQHGYHVLGIITGAFESVAGLAPNDDAVTGVFSATLPVSALDLQQWTFPTLSRQSSGVIRRIAWIVDRDPSARVVLNTSLNDRGHPARTMAARSWVEKVRGADRAHQTGVGYETAFLHVTSAGNAKEHPTTGALVRWQAVDNSFWAYAALGDLSRLLATDYPNLTNVHVIENRVDTRDGDIDPATGNPARPLPGCAIDSSIMGGTLSAMGTTVWSFGAEADPNVGEFKTGTSMSTPQVAGVALWAFALAPQLSGPELAELLARVAHDRPTTTLSRGSPAIPCNAQVPRPVVDAYDVVLAAGGAAARLALLDENGDGAFDERDVATLVQAFAASPHARRFARLDLDGDGRVGQSERSERFDLNGDRAFGEVERIVSDASGATRTVRYDERAVNDMDVLCYYAYGPLYGGDLPARDRLIGDRCAGNPLLVILDPVEGSRRSGTVSLRARLDPPPDAPGADLSAYRIYWSYRTVAGQTIQIGASRSGDTLTGVRFLCSDVVLDARARYAIPPVSSARVTFEALDAGPARWQAEIVSPLSHTVHVDPVALAAGMTLVGQARRATCHGPELTSSGLTWLDEEGRQLATGPNLPLAAEALSDGAGYRTRTLTLSHHADGRVSQAKVRVVPCSSLPLSGLLPCPDAWPELRDDLVAKHQQLVDLLDPDVMRGELLERLELTFGTTLPAPFPFATPQLVSALESELPSLLLALLNELLTGALVESSSVAFDAALERFSVDARIGALTHEEHAFLAEVVAVAVASQSFYAAVDVGGAAGFDAFVFASEAVRASVNPVVPAHAAVRGFLHGYLLTNTSPILAVGAYDLGASRAGARDSGLLAAVNLLVEFGP